MVTISRKEVVISEDIKIIQMKIEIVKFVEH